MPGYTLTIISPLTSPPISFSPLPSSHPCLALLSERGRSPLGINKEWHLKLRQLLPCVKAGHGIPVGRIGSKKSTHAPVRNPDTPDRVSLKQTKLHICPVHTEGLDQSHAGSLLVYPMLLSSKELRSAASVGPVMILGPLGSPIPPPSL